MRSISDSEPGKSVSNVTHEAFFAFITARGEQDEAFQGLLGGMFHVIWLRSISVWENSWRGGESIWLGSGDSLADSADPGSTIDSKCFILINRNEIFIFWNLAQFFFFISHMLVVWAISYISLCSLHFHSWPLGEDEIVNLLVSSKSSIDINANSMRTNRPVFPLKSDELTGLMAWNVDIPTSALASTLNRNQRIASKIIRDLIAFDEKLKMN